MSAQKGPENSGETTSPPEPQVWTEDVRKALLAALKGLYGLPVPLVAHKAGVSERTVYRIKDGEYDRLMDLDMADRMLMACDAEISACHVEHADGRVESPL